MTLPLAMPDAARLAVSPNCAEHDSRSSAAGRAFAPRTLVFDRVRRGGRRRALVSPVYVASEFPFDSGEYGLFRMGIMEFIGDEKFCFQRLRIKEYFYGGVLYAGR